MLEADPELDWSMTIDWGTGKILALYCKLQWWEGKGKHCSN